MIPENPILLISGTWSDSGKGDGKNLWWEPGVGALWADLNERGYRLPEPRDPFRWDSRLSVTGPKYWKAWSRALCWWWNDRAITDFPESELIPIVIAHSHGGQVALSAAAAGMDMHLITLETPHRPKVPVSYGPLKSWTNVHTDEPLVNFRKGWKPGISWGRLGQWFNGAWDFQLDQPEAQKNIEIKGLTHTDLVNPEVWQENDLYGFLEVIGNA